MIFLIFLRELKPLQGKMMIVQVSKAEATVLARHIISNPLASELYILYEQRFRVFSITF